MSELGEILGKSIQNQNKMQQSLIKPGSNVKQYVINNYRLRARVINIKTEQQDAGTSFIFGHSTKGLVGSGSIGSNAGAWVTIDNQGLFIIGDGGIGAQGAGGTLSTEKDIFQQLHNTGRTSIRDFLRTGSEDYPSYLALGSGTLVPTVDQTAMDNEFERLNNLRLTSSTSNKTVEKIHEISPYDAEQNHGSRVHEVGYFNAATNGDLFNRILLDTSFLLNRNYRYRTTITYKLTDRTPGQAVIVDSGLNLVRDWIADDTNLNTPYTGWGINNVIPVSTETTTLGAEQDRNQVSERRSASSYSVMYLTELGKSEPLNSSGTVISPSLYRTAIFDGQIGGAPYVLDNCETANWGTSTDSAEETTVTKYIEGTYGLGLRKDGTSTQTFYYDKTVGNTYNATSGTYLNMGMSIDDITYLAGTNTMEIRIGSDSSNYYYNTYDNGTITNGWNIIMEDVSSLGTIGSPDISALDYLYIGFNTSASTGTVPADVLRMDYWHLINVGTATMMAVSKISRINKTSTFAIRNQDYFTVV